jgi:putative oxidoreductase
MTERARFDIIVYSALRMLCGFMIACHGADKLFGLFGPRQPVGSQMWIGAIIELAGGVLVALGFYARPAAFILAGQMAVAYFQFHWKLAFAGGKFLPLVNHGELAVVYCFVMLLIWARGSGPYSLDGRGGAAPLP